MERRGTESTKASRAKPLRLGVLLAALAVALLLPTSAFATAPTATTRPATNVTSTSAFLNGFVNAQDKATSWHFDYATDADFTSSGTYTNSTPGGQVQICIVVCVPVLEVDVSESERVANLTPGTVYHFRFVASNADGTTQGSDATFTTAP